MGELVAEAGGGRPTALTLVGPESVLAPVAARFGALRPDVVLTTRRCDAPAAAELVRDGVADACATLRWPGAGRLLDGAAHLLADPAAPPGLRKAVFEIMPRIDGVRLVGPSTDGLGRPGTAIVGSTGSSGHAEIILDPDHGRVLGRRTVNPDEDGSVRGLVTSATTFVVSGVVTSTDQRL